MVNQFIELFFFYLDLIIRHCQHLLFHSVVSKKKIIVGLTNLFVNMDLLDFFSHIRAKNDHWVQTRANWNPTSRIFPFSERLWNNTQLFQVAI